MTAGVMIWPAAEVGEAATEMGEAAAEAGAAAAGEAAAAATGAAEPPLSTPGAISTTHPMVNNSTSSATKPAIRRELSLAGRRRPKITSAAAAAPSTAYGSSQGFSRATVLALGLMSSPTQRIQPAPQVKASATAATAASGGTRPRTVSLGRRRARSPPGAPLTPKGWSAQ